MKFFLLCMLAGFLLCLSFLLFDKPGSGMGYGVAAFGVIGAGVALYNKARYGSIFKEGK